MWLFLQSVDLYPDLSRILVHIEQSPSVVFALRLVAGCVQFKICYTSVTIHGSAVTVI